MATHESHRAALRQRDAMAVEVLGLRKQIEELRKPDAALDLAALVAEIAALRSEIARLKAPASDNPQGFRQPDAAPDPNGCGKKHFGCHCPLCRAALERPDPPASENPQGFRQPAAEGMYPPGWPKCACGDYCLDGKRTCGRVECL